MEVAVEVGKRERWRLQFGEGTAPRLSVERDRGHSRVGVDHNGSAERRTHGREIEVAARKELGGVAHRHAHVVPAESFGLQLPTQRFGKLRGFDEEPAVDGISLDRARVSSLITVTSTTWRA